MTNLVTQDPAVNSGEQQQSPRELDMILYDG